MKSTLAGLLFVTMMSVSFAHAGNEGPNGSPVPVPALPPQASVIAQVEFFPGLTPTPGFWETLVQLRADGRLEAVRGPSVRWVATLAPDVVAKLAKEIEALAPSPLVDMQQSAPPCLDAPVTRYVVFQRITQRVDIAQYSGCHEYEMSNGQGTELKRVLEGLETLSRH